MSSCEVDPISRAYVATGTSPVSELIVGFPEDVSSTDVTFSAMIPSYYLGRNSATVNLTRFSSLSLTRQGKPGGQYQHDNGRLFFQNTLKHATNKYKKQINKITSTNKHHNPWLITALHAQIWLQRRRRWWLLLAPSIVDDALPSCGPERN